MRNLLDSCVELTLAAIQIEGVMWLFTPAHACCMWQRKCTDTGVYIAVLIAGSSDRGVTALRICIVTL